MSEFVNRVYEMLSAEIALTNKRIDTVITLTERAETAGGMATATLAEAQAAPADTLSNGDMWFISNGRKTGEAAGAGTGLPCWYNAATGEWLKFSDNLVVSI